MTSEQEQSLIEHDIEAFLRRHQEKELLRFVTVGSVDDGKSTLIGRLLYDTRGIYEDQLTAVRRASKQEGTDIDLALVTDGLKAEREQGITIDVAYRYFATERRKLIIADTPGHVQYTRNMATGASTAHLAVILIDARLGVLQQSRRHAFIASLLGIRELTVCVNKMDLVAFDDSAFSRIRDQFGEFCARLGFDGVTFIPVSALGGDNVVNASRAMPWYDGPTLLSHLETVPLPQVREGDAFRYPVQLVLRPNLDYRAYAGQVVSGQVRPGDRVMSLPSRKTTTVLSIDTFEGQIDSAFAPMSVALRLADEIDVSRGDMLVHPEGAPAVRKRFSATLVWMAERPLDLDKSYFLKHSTQLLRAEVERVDHVVNLDTLAPESASHLELNDIGKVIVSCHKPLFCDTYEQCRATGAFVLIDPISNYTVAAGMIQSEELAEPDEQSPPARGTVTRVSRGERLDRMQQAGQIVWLTGLPGAGKSELAYALERRLFDAGRVAIVVDPHDGLGGGGGPHGGSPLHAPEMARRFAEAGVIAIFAFASPMASDRRAVCDAVGTERFFEVHVTTPLAECRERDHRGSYDALHGPLEYEAPDESATRVSLSEADADTHATTLAELLLARTTR
ncbi:MAG: sulfate adenylyltransferase subunit CysN [Polyangiaceae bacterium]